MCGIVALVGSRDAAPQLLEGLRQLEYRGYDSAGLATVDAGSGQLHCLRASGKLINLSNRFDALGAPGQCGIGHTRWATHGAPTDGNAHPHVAGRVAVVHNGIIENFRELRRALEDSGATLTSETDTEPVAHLLDRALGAGAGLGATRSDWGATEEEATEAAVSAEEAAEAAASAQPVEPDEPVATEPPAEAVDPLLAEPEQVAAD